MPAQDELDQIYEAIGASPDLPAFQFLRELLSRLYPDSRLTKPHAAMATLIRGAFAAGNLANVKRLYEQSPSSFEGADLHDLDTPDAAPILRFLTAAVPTLGSYIVDDEYGLHRDLLSRGVTESVAISLELGRRLPSLDHLLRHALKSGQLSALEYLVRLGGSFNALTYHDLFELPDDILDYIHSKRPSMFEPQVTSLFSRLAQGQSHHLSISLGLHRPSDDLFSSCSRIRRPPIQRIPSPFPFSTGGVASA